MPQLDPLSLQASSANNDTQYLTFSLGAEEYGVEILKVQEIRGFSAVTPIPNTPPYVKGVMNLRGTVVPVIDLRLRLGMPPVEYNQFTVIIVMTVGTKIVGTVVDGVSDVLGIAAAEVQPTPNFGGGVDVRFIGGIARSGEKLVVLLDVDAVLRDQDIPAGDELP